jgi:hypothetical protein
MVENDPLTHALGGPDTVFTALCLFLILGMFPGVLRWIINFVEATIGGAFRLLFSAAAWVFWVAWKKPRLETKMWVHEQESRQLLGAGSRVPARFRARVAREIARNEAREQKITEKYFAEKAASEKAMLVGNESAKRPLVAPQLARVSTSWTDEQDRFFRSFKVTVPRDSDPDTTMF